MSYSPRGRGTEGAGVLPFALATVVVSFACLSSLGRALRFAAANAELNGIETRVAQSDVLAAAEGPLDLIVANPPYLADSLHRSYRDGGRNLGTALSVRIVEESLQRLPAGGRLLLYTATPVIGGAHVLWPSLEPRLRGTRYDYREPTPAQIEQVTRIKAICDRYDVPLAAAALQFPLAHPAVASVIPGPVSPAQVQSNVQAVRHPIPADLWRDLKAVGLVRENAPTPAGEMVHAS